MNTKLFCLTLALALVGSPQLKGDMIILKLPGFNEVEAIAGGISAPSEFTVVTATISTLPAFGSVTAVHPAGTPTATATHSYGLKPTFASSPAFFDHKFLDFSHSAVEGQRATAEAHFEFKVDAPGIYSIDGMFAVDDAGASFGKVELAVEFVDISAGAGSPVTLFKSMQSSLATTDELLIVGDPMGGDDINVIMGSPVGLLDPSKTYAFFFTAETRALSSTLAGVTASGGVSFMVSAVPEPSSAGLVALAIGVLTIRRKTRIL